LAGPIELVEYDPAWPRLYLREAQRIRLAMGDRALRIEHTGSTSVPGLVAKPIVDIVLVVDDSADELGYIPALADAGYILRIREPEWHQHRLLKPPAGNVHLHVFSRNCPEVSGWCCSATTCAPARKIAGFMSGQSASWPASPGSTCRTYADAKSAVIEEILARAHSGGSADS